MTDKKEYGIEELIRKIVLETNTQIQIGDAKKIVQVIMPEIDRVIEEKVALLCSDVDAMIANKVSEHFLLMGVYMSKKFKPNGD